MHRHFIDTLAARQLPFNRVTSIDLRRWISNDQGRVLADALFPLQRWADGRRHDRDAGHACVDMKTYCPRT